MDIGIYNIIAIFYFAYWIIYKNPPFGIWWFILIFGISYIVVLLISMMFEKSTSNVTAIAKRVANKREEMYY